ncbi:hypothetical protein F4815DRAFT_35574 [Daldinia loculata]|nr:hypothetical protein F4815DRAFT_35574 [Daldinia loculata]
MEEEAGDAKLLRLIEPEDNDDAKRIIMQIDSRHCDRTLEAIAKKIRWVCGDEGLGKTSAISFNKRMTKGLVYGRGRNSSEPVVCHGLVEKAPPCRLDFEASEAHQRAFPPGKGKPNKVGVGLAYLRIYFPQKPITDEEFDEICKMEEEKKKRSRPVVPKARKRKLSEVEEGEDSAVRP